MAAIKSYTDLDQSKKLAEILPIGSADNHYWSNGYNNYICGLGNSIELKEKFEEKGIKYLPCWSLAALLGVLEHPRCFQGDKPIYWFCGCFGKDELYHEVEADNPINACYKMILRLNKLELL